MPDIEGVLDITSPSFTAELATGGGDVFLAAANLFTAMQSIDVDVPVTPLADAGTVKPTVLVHLHDDEGPRVDLWASSIDFGGGVIVSSAGRLTRRIGFDGAPTDVYLLESYAFVGISTITDEPLYRYFLAEVESSDPGEIPYLSDLFATEAAPIRVGEPTELDDATTKRYVDATVAAVGPTPPLEPADAETAIWNRTPGDLRAFADFRLISDGPINGVDANGAGGSIAPPPLIRSFLDIYPAFGGVAPVVTDGVVRSTGEAVDGDDPTPRTGFTFEGVEPGTDGRIEWGFGGYTETDATFTTYSPTNVAISAPYDALPEGAAGPDAYLGGFVVGRFVGNTDATDPGQPVSMRCKIIRDDLGAPTTVASAALPRMPIPGVDRVAFTWTSANRFAVEFNGVEIVSATDTTHDLTEFTGIGMVMHQGSDGAHTWEDAYYCGVEWFGISAGDQITGDLGPHRWTDSAGWQPIGPGARPTSAFSDALNVTTVNGETGPAVTLSAADVGAPTTAQLADLSGVNPALTATARGNLGLGGLATLNAVTGAEIATGSIGFAWLDTAVAAAVNGATPNTRTITAGTGLTGGGTLAADRTLAVDSATLARIGTTVEAATDSTARTSTTYTADGTLQFEGAADTTYRVDCYAIFTGDPAGDLKVGFTTPAGTLHLTVEGPLTSATSGSDYDRYLSLTASGGTAVVGVNNTTAIGIRVSGVIRLTSAGTVSFGWAPNAAGTGATRLARSQLYYRAA